MADPCDLPAGPTTLRTVPPPAPPAAPPPRIPDPPEPPPQVPEPASPDLPGTPPTPSYTGDGPLPADLPGSPGYAAPTFPPPPPDTQVGDFITPGPAGRVPVPGGVQLPTGDPGDLAPYQRYACTVGYHYVSGLVQSPVAQAPSAATPKPAAVTGRRHAPYTVKTVRYFAERAGAQPLMPLPVPDGPAQVLLSADVEPDQPHLEPGGHNLIFRVSAVYVYALAQPQTPDQGYDVGVPAFSTLADADTFLPAQNFVGGIV
jgi:hypothetical protein